MEPIITVNEYPIGWEWLDKVPLEELIPEHLHMINALKEIQNYWDLTSERVIITDIIPIPQP